MNAAPHGPDDDRAPSLPVLWGALLIAPAAWGLQLSVSYVLVPYLCRAGMGTTVLQIVSGLALGTALGGLGLAWHAWRGSGRGWTATGGSRRERARFMALIGLLLSALLLAAILAQALPTFLLDPCL